MKQTAASGSRRAARLFATLGAPAAVLGLAVACAERRGSIGDDCLEDQDCLSGVCSGLRCVAAPPVLGSESGETGSPVAEAGEASSDALAEATGDDGSSDAPADSSGDVAPSDAPADAGAADSAADAEGPRDSASDSTAPDATPDAGARSDAAADAAADAPADARGGG